MANDPYVLVEHALDESARQRLLAGVISANPHLDGIHVADVLDQFDDADAFLGYREPYWEQHGEQLRDRLDVSSALIRASNLAVLLLLRRRDEADPVIDDHLVELTENLARAAAGGQREAVGL